MRMTSSTKFRLPYSVTYQFSQWIYSKFLKYFHVAGIFRDETSDVINSTVECLKEKLDEGIPELSIPSLNPLELNDLDLDFTGTDYLR